MSAVAMVTVGFAHRVSRRWEAIGLNESPAQRIPEQDARALIDTRRCQSSIWTRA
jgi:hypothetical protein